MGYLNANNVGWYALAGGIVFVLLLNMLPLLIVLLLQRKRQQRPPTKAELEKLAELDEYESESESEKKEHSSSVNSGARKKKKKGGAKGPIKKLGPKEFKTEGAVKNEEGTMLLKPENSGQ